MLGDNNFSYENLTSDLMSTYSELMRPYQFMVMKCCCIGHMIRNLHDLRLFIAMHIYQVALMWLLLLADHFVISTLRSLGLLYLKYFIYSTDNSEMSKSILPF